MPERPPRLVLAVIDGLKPSMLERAVEEGRAPVLGTLMERGRYVDGCAAAFPSVTPVCAATIATGVGQDRHLIPSMNWYMRSEDRYVEYGSSFSAARRFGIARQLTDTVYNMNGAHLALDVRTVFEILDDAGVRTAGTTYLMYRGRHRHEVARDTALTRIASTLMRHSVLGPRELFYADIFASRRTGCRSQLGAPGRRDQHAGCVGAHLVEHDLCDFMLLSLPDNDWYSHRNGPHAQVDSIAEADRQMARVADAAGGLDAFLEQYAVIVVADHSHAAVERAIPFFADYADFAVRQPGDAAGEDAEIALCPAQRAALVYILVPEARDALLGRVIERGLEIEGVELAMWMDRSSREGVIASARGELRFAPGESVADPRGLRWNLEGDLAVLDARVQDGVLQTPSHPDALSRSWSAIASPTSGDVALSAGPGYEFPDWGGAAHIGGGSHGSLHGSDSLGALVYCGTGPAPEEEPAQWSIRDIAPMVAGHFGLDSEQSFSEPPGWRHRPESEARGVPSA